MLKGSKKVLQKNKPIALVFIVALVIRVFLLHRFPIGITHDELNYIIAAKSIFYTGGFAPGTASALLPSGLDNLTVVIAEVPAILLTALIGWAENSLFNARIVGAVFSSTSIVVFYFLVKKLFDKRIALITSLVFAFNPWSILMGRTIFEVNFFVLFFLIGFLVLLHQKPKGIYKAFPWYLLGFFSYTGGQASFYLFTVLTFLYHFFLQREKTAKRNYVFSILFMTLAFLGYLFVVMQNQASISRGGELYYPFTKEVKQLVDKERKLSVPSIYNNLFINKATVYTKGWFDKYLNAFSTDDLFINGETRAAFSYQKHGTFYILDFLFLLAGLGFLFKKDKKLWMFTIAFIAASTVTGALSAVEQSYSQRTGLMYPFLILFVGLGINYLFSETKKKTKILGFALLAVYGLMFANLMHTYFFRFPVYASDGWFYQDRIMANYINLAAKEFPDKNIVVVSFEPKIVFQEYLFYTNGYEDKESVTGVNNNMSKDKYFYKNVFFIDQCPISGKKDKDTIYMYDRLMECVEYESPKLSRITRFQDVLAMYLIENDELCNDFEQRRYVHPEAYSSFDIENKSAKEFCTDWIVKVE